jgi:hypothetical protein
MNDTILYQPTKHELGLLMIVDKHLEKWMMVGKEY